MNLANVQKLRDVVAEVGRSAPHRLDTRFWYAVRQPNVPRTLSVSAYNQLGLYGLGGPKDFNPQEQMGVCACLAGWCQMAFAVGPELDVPAPVFATHFLGLSLREGSHWFMPRSELSSRTQAQIVLEFLDREIAVERARSALVKCLKVKAGKLAEKAEKAVKRVRRPRRLRGETVIALSFERVSGGPDWQALIDQAWCDSEPVLRVRELAPA